MRQSRGIGILVGLGTVAMVLASVMVLVDGNERGPGTGASDGKVQVSGDSQDAVAPDVARTEEDDSFRTEGELSGSSEADPARPVPELVSYQDILAGTEMDLGVELQSVVYGLLGGGISPDAWMAYVADKMLSAEAVALKGRGGDEVGGWIMYPTSRGTMGRLSLTYHRATDGTQGVGVRAPIPVQEWLPYAGDVVRDAYVQLSLRGTGSVEQAMELSGSLRFTVIPEANARDEAELLFSGGDLGREVRLFAKGQDGYFLFLPYGSVSDREHVGRGALTTLGINSAVGILESASRMASGE